jgi:hypothetical protein
LDHHPPAPRGRAGTDRRGRPIENRTLNSGAKAAARSRFEGTKQRFFAQVLLSLKLPSIYPAVDEHLAAGESVVVQLVSTAESILNRRLNELDPEEREALDLDLSPREAFNVELNIKSLLCSRSLCRAWRREAQVSFGFP